MINIVRFVRFTMIVGGSGFIAYGLGLSDWVILGVVMVAAAAHGAIVDR